MEDQSVTVKNLRIWKFIEVTKFVGDKEQKYKLIMTKLYNYNNVYHEHHNTKQSIQQKIVDFTVCCMVPHESQTSNGHCKFFGNK